MVLRRLLSLLSSPAPGSGRHGLGLPDDADDRATPGQTNVATLAAGSRLWVVGALHGESRRADNLHRRMALFMRPGDHVVYLGNMIGRGPDAAGVLEVLTLSREATRRHFGEGAGRFVYLRGLQEVMWERVATLPNTPDPAQALQWMLEQGLGPTLTAFGSNDSHLKEACAHGDAALSEAVAQAQTAAKGVVGYRGILGRLRDAARTADDKVVMVSAGMDVNLPLAEQWESLWWGDRGFRAGERNARDGGPGLLIRGFDRDNRGPVFGRQRITLDGGSGREGYVMAVLIGPQGRPIETVEA